MDPLLLITKVRIPPQPWHEVPRGRLVDALESALPRHKLLLLSAPAGYGKTTLLSQWARGSRFPIAWLSLDEEDNDLERFFRYLLKGWQEIQPDVLESPLGLLLGARMPDVQAVLSAFINLASEVSGHMAFVLDDYHLIEDAAIHESLTFLLDHLPPAVHLVLASRSEPLLPLARYRARGELLELQMADLQFMPEETAAFLTEQMELKLTPDEVAKLQGKSEGWIAGLQLAALGLRRELAGADSLALSGRQRFIADYLAEDVLAPLASDRRQFLLQTSILDALSAPLCEAVTGRQGGQETLAALERENLFLRPLDDRREWFRYHPLFADFLQSELSRHKADEVAELHRRAGRWYLAQDMPEPAFEHALAGEQVQLALEIFDKHFLAKLNAGELGVVKRWLGAVPADWYAAYPVIDLMRAGLMAVAGQFEAIVGLLEEIEQRLTAAEGEEAGWQRRWLMAVRCFMACVQNDVPAAESYADRALHELPDDDRSIRPGVLGALGDTYRRNARWQEAKACYLKALELRQAPPVRPQATHLFGALADLELRQGRLQKAAGYWRQAVAAMQAPENWGRLELPLTGWVYIRMAELLYEWNELAEAWDFLSPGLERAELGGDARARMAGYLLAGRLKLTAGDLVAAGGFLEKARPLLEGAPFPDWTGRFSRLQLEFWLAQDRLRAAVSWADAGRLDEAGHGPLESEEAQLALSRVQIVKGDRPSIEGALVLLRRLLQTAEAEGRAGLVIEGLALEALAHGGLGDLAAGLTSLERALRLAEPDGFVRLFVDLGLPMGRLLQEARSRGVRPDYVEKLLAAFSAGLSLREPATKALPEPLTERENEVLRLIAAGLTNREVAQQLVVSPETVKKHTSSIYAKLGVSSRTAAAARARELKLFN
ncbi:MAG: LuxR C-terminal-related transcriptional regulator [Candidatus Promineifilaceae bacterium]